MTTSEPTHSWQTVRSEVLRRIHSREWAPGELIPHESDLALEFGCARATMNRALREVAVTGLIERRRRAGTRVALHPVRKAKLDIPILRVGIESLGGKYSYKLVSRAESVPPSHILALLQSPPQRAILHIIGLHLADGHPHALEDRWIDTDAVPGSAETTFAQISPNEWLVLNVPFEGVDIAFSAAVAEKLEAETLRCAIGSPLFVTERTTWHGERTLTTVRLLFPPGYRLHTQI